MSATKTLNEYVEKAVTAGNYKIGYSKDDGAYTPLPELEVDIPVGRKIDKLKLTIGGNEVDV